jgi:hypothetical protein
MRVWLVAVVASLGLAPTPQDPAASSPQGQVVSEGQCQVPAGSLPADIHTYYTDHNLVHAFSTPGERALLVGEPEEVQDERMIQIGRLMARLTRRSVQLDPEMVQSAKGAARLSFPRTDLFEVRSWSRIDGALEVELEAYHLEPGPNLHLIQQYGERPLEDWLLSSDQHQLAALAGSPIATSRETHRWVCVGGTWKRMPTTKHFLAQ